MIDLTPLDVRNKRGDFKKNLRGYDPQEVDTFLELAAERLEQLVMENLRLGDRVEALQEQVDSQSGREKAVQEALVTAQELRSEMRGHAERESELVLAEARTEARRLVAEAEAEARTLLRDTERRLEEGRQALEELERRRHRFLKSFRQLLEREMDVVQVEEERAPLEEHPIELDLLGGFGGEAEAPADEPAPFFSADEAADDVRELIERLDAIRGVVDREPEPPHAGRPAEAPEGDETLRLSLDEEPASEDDDRWG